MDGGEALVCWDKDPRELLHKQNKSSDQNPMLSKLDKGRSLLIDFRFCFVALCCACSRWGPPFVTWQQHSLHSHV